MTKTDARQTESTQRKSADATSKQQTTGGPTTARRSAAGASTPDARSTLRKALGFVIAVSLPLFLLGATLGVLVNSGWIYSYNWWRNDIPRQTGIERPELNFAARTIKAYFNAPDSNELLNVRVVIDGRERPIYNEREILHMRDVKVLINRFYTVGRWAAVAGLAALVVGVALSGGRFAATVVSAVKWSAIGSVAFIAFIGIASLINFNAVWLVFHQIGFSNDLWALNYNDYLLLMFPQRFWFETTLMLGVLLAAEFAGAYALARLAKRLTTRIRSTGDR